MRRGITVDVHRIVITASTSEAYALIFKVLADAGDEVLVPTPSYPLFEHLTRLDLVVPKPYDLVYDGVWSIDFESVARAWTPRTRAVLVVSPNNPTGSFVKRQELARLSAICAAGDAAIVADEVFADYVLDSAAARAAAPAAGEREALTFSLGGLSKSVGLPQLKLGWMTVSGPEALVDSALERLELACDTYLSVATPVQLAASRLLSRGAVIREQIATRIAANYGRLCAEAKRTPSCTVLPAEGGWYAVLRVPSVQAEEDLVLDLLSRDDVLVHPGFFFDFPQESYLIVSLLPPESAFLEGVRRILRRSGGGA
jgi:aspartate/methionine/tyrosine aminotransferase